MFFTMFMSKLNAKHSVKPQDNASSIGGALTSVATEKVKPYTTQFRPQGLDFEPDQKQMVAAFMDNMQGHLVLDFIFEDLEDFKSATGDLAEAHSFIKEIRYLIKTHPQCSGNTPEYRDAMKFLRPLELLLSQIHNNWLPEIQELYKTQGVIVEDL